MLAIDRWRNWRPSDEKFEDSLGCELTKPTKTTFVSFDGSVSSQMQNFSDVSPDHDPAAWREDFTRWVQARCARRESREDWGGIGCLWVNFCEWTVENDSVPCQRRTFEQLLQDAGFPVEDGMARGLLLWEDLEAVLLSQAASQEASRQPASAKGKRRTGRRA